MKTPLTVTLGITSLLLTLGSSPAHAVSTILRPNSVTSNLTVIEGFSLDNLINQSGLSRSYTSGVTPWSEVNTITATSREVRRNTWAGQLTSQSRRLTFDLGRRRGIQGLALWNVNTNDSINQFELYADNDNDFNNGGTTRLGMNGNFTFSAPVRTDTTLSVDTFSFTATETRYVHLNILSNHGTAEIVATSEIAFRTPLEFGHLPGIIFAVSLGYIHYFRNKRGGKDK